MKYILVLTVLVPAIVFFLAQLTFACNEAVCASIVSKCMLLQSCKCDLHPDCTCCKKCFECLDYLYSECCSCVEMCPKPNETIHELSKKSHVEDLSEHIPQLFQALTTESDPQSRWTIFTFPVDISSSVFAPAKKAPPTAVIDNNNPVLDPIKEAGLVTVNCTVAYMSQCMSWNKCKASCTSMGANSYRWFHDGCCQCVGHQCINYGINESRCSDCPLLDEAELTDEEIEQLINMKVGDEFQAAAAGAVVTEKAAPAATTANPPPK